MTNTTANPTTADEWSAAPCWVCGVTVPAGTGRVDPEPWLGVAQSVASQLRGDVIRQGWTRRHSACSNSLGDVLSRILGEELTPSEARQVRERAGAMPLIASHAPTLPKSKTAFAFVTKADHDALADAWAYVKPRSRGMQSEHGGCALCGVRISTGWEPAPVTWQDGSAAELCGRCARAWHSALRPTDADGIREVAQSLLTGADRLIGVPHLGMRIFADVATDERDGHEQPWTYATAALEKIQRREWMLRPKFAPDAESRERAEREAAEERAQLARRRREQSDAQRPGNDIDWTL